METLKNLFNNASAKKTALVASVGTAITAISSTASAAIDLTTVEAAIAAAESDALTTGQYVIGTVASLVVVTLIIVMVRKL